MLNVSDIITKTQQYWRKEIGARNDSPVKRYIENLLPDELEFAERGTHWPQAAERGGLLAFMLGFSPEPLIQTIVAYKPTQVLVLLNHEYEYDPQNPFGKKPGVEYFKDYFNEAFGLLKTGGLLSQVPEILPKPLSIAGDSPQEIFRFLQTHLLQPRNQGALTPRNIVLDITGAKKSMVAGAYLFAAFAGGVDVSYVDFGLYDPTEGKPYGFTCEIKKLSDPAHNFRLLEWERARRHYDNYAFRSAQKLIVEELLPPMSKWFGADAPEIAATKLLSEALEVYAAWDNGDYCGALEQYEKIKGRLKPDAPFPLPAAITTLGAKNYWPHVETDVPQTLKEKAEKLIERLGELELGWRENGEEFPPLYLDMSRLLTYAYDELEKIKRLIEKKEDFRSALLRAVSLGEVLLRARLTILAEKELVQITIEAVKKPKDTSTKGKPDKEKWEEISSEVATLKSVLKRRIALKASVQDFIPALQYDANGNGDVRKKCAWLPITDKNKDLDTDRRNFFIRRANSSPLLAECVPWRNEENNLRHKAIHTYLSLPKEVAEGARQVVEQNLEDFRAHCATLLQDKLTPPPTAHATWDELCKACGIYFLPQRGKGAQQT